MTRRLSIVVALCLAPLSVAQAQLEPIVEDRGAVGLALQLRKLAAGATFLHTTAHPDDEDNGLLVMLSRGRGLRTSLLTVTRGDGGQNEIGSELFEAIGILRTEELMAMHRIDGADQYFTRAYEFGYSFSVEETLEKWGEEEILKDIVRLIRMIRPDVVVSLPPEGEGGGQHHQTSARLTREAFSAAADPYRFPEQIAQGLRPWQPLKLYSRTRVGPGREPDAASSNPDAHLVRMDTGIYDPILGRSYYQMGAEARANHRCQGMGQLRAAAGPHDSLWKLEDARIEVDENEQDLFDGIPMGIERIKTFTDAAFVHEALDAIAAEVEAAGDALVPTEPWKTLPPLRRGLQAIRALRSEIGRAELSDDERFELEHRLAPKEEDFEQAIALAHGLVIAPTTPRGEVTRGSTFRVDIGITNPSPEPIELIEAIVNAPAGWHVTPVDEEKRPFPAMPASLATNATISAGYDVVVGTDAAYDRPYWARPDGPVDRFVLLEPEHFGLPWRPPLVTSRVVFRSGDVEVSSSKTVQHRYEGRWVGDEKQKVVSVLPLVSVALSPSVVVFPTGADDKTRPVSVTALYKGTDPVDGTLKLEPPPGWSVSPKGAALHFERENQAVTMRFDVTPPENVTSGTYGVKAVARVDEKEFREGVQTIAYHHIQTRYLFHPAEARIEALDLQVAPVSVGYVMGVGDEVPVAIRQLGAKIAFLAEEQLAEGDLSQYDVIMTGVRAYENREDLRAYNRRLLDYVAEGGTLLVQYNKFEFNEAQWGPYPKKVSRNRVTVEEAPIEILVPDHPVFNEPNKITEEDWDGWVQERGLYFLEEEGDPRYRDLIASEDPWEYNQGVKKGLLVEAKYGEGRWIYIGLGFFRQLPAGVPSAYKLFANLLSLKDASSLAGE
ncbi:MAG TPA: PIG-L family deacetylase [Vicinamibacteria bacterium]|nr:PIG-L family deacetylase [Vicinamibacteria bacterium]